MFGQCCKGPPIEGELKFDEPDRGQKKNKPKGGSTAPRSNDPSSPKATPYMVDNSILQIEKRPGVAYRYSKREGDKVRSEPAKWGEIVEGVDEGDGWLKVGQFYLPMTYQGSPVITPVVGDKPKGSEGSGRTPSAPSTSTGQGSSPSANTGLKPELRPTADVVSPAKDPPASKPSSPPAKISSPPSPPAPAPEPAVAPAKTSSPAASPSSQLPQVGLAPPQQASSEQTPVSKSSVVPPADAPSPQQNRDLNSEIAKCVDMPDDAKIDDAKIDDATISNAKIGDVKTVDAKICDASAVEQPAECTVSAVVEPKAVEVGKCDDDTKEVFVPAWFHKPSVGSWLQACPRVLAVEVAAAQEKSATEEDEEDIVDWYLLPSVGTWIHMGPRRINLGIAADVKKVCEEEEHQIEKLKDVEECDFQEAPLKEA